MHLRHGLYTMCHGVRGVNSQRLDPDSFLCTCNPLQYKCSCKGDKGLLNRLFFVDALIRSSGMLNTISFCENGKNSNSVLIYYM